MQSNIIVLDIPENKSSLLSKIEYDTDNFLLTVHFRKYFTDKITYKEVIPKIFDEFTKQHSLGKYYLHHIKPNFKQFKQEVMSDKKRPKGINIAKNEVRWIDISIDVQKINKDWLTQGEKGVYLNLKLRMLPDGTVDNYDCLGFIVQSVPSEIYKAAEQKEKGSGKKIEGIILGNAKELDWSNRNEEGIPGSQYGQIGVSDDIADDLPF